MEMTTTTTTANISPSNNVSAEYLSGGQSLVVNGSVYTKPEGGGGGEPDLIPQNQICMSSPITNNISSTENILNQADEEEEEEGFGKVKRFFRHHDQEAEINLRNNALMNGAFVHSEQNTPQHHHQGHRQLFQERHIYANQLSSDSLYPNQNPATWDRFSGGAFYSPQMGYSNRTVNPGGSPFSQRRNQMMATLPHNKAGEPGSGNGDWRGSGPVFRDFGYPSDFGLPMTMPRNFGGDYGHHNQHRLANPLMGDLVAEENGDILAPLNSSSPKLGYRRQHHQQQPFVSSPASMARFNHENAMAMQEYLSASATPTTSGRIVAPSPAENGLMLMSPPSVESPPSSSNNASSSGVSTSNGNKANKAVTMQRTSSGSARESPDEGIQDDVSTDV